MFLTIDYHGVNVQNLLCDFQDLCDRLNDICDNRKELAEKERQSIMNEGWLEDRLGLLTNFYITLMQVEVDRYQDTVRLLRDYYVGMEGEGLSTHAYMNMQLKASWYPDSFVPRNQHFFFFEAARQRTWTLGAKLPRVILSLLPFVYLNWLE